MSLANRLGEYTPRRVARPDLTPCGVLLLLLEAEEYRLVLIQRRFDLTRHAGQIACPGGRCEPEDPDCAFTALRETHEEIGVPPERVEVVGQLDDVWTPSGFLLTPFVGVVRPTVDLRPCNREVAEIFTVSVPELMDPRHYAVEEREYEGVRYRLSVFEVGPWRIWGATARLVHNLLEVGFGWSPPL